MKQLMRARTTQKLYMARICLDGWESGFARKALPTECEASREACLFHLVGAYRSLLGEMLESVGVGVLVKTAQLASLEADRHGKSMLELTALIQFEEAGNSWLSVLLKKWESCWLPLQNDESVNRPMEFIPIKDLNGETDPFAESLENYRVIYASLKELIAWVRTQMVEW